MKPSESWSQQERIPVSGNEQLGFNTRLMSAVPMEDHWTKHQIPPVNDRSAVAPIADGTTSSAKGP